MQTGRLAPYPGYLKPNQTLGKHYDRSTLACSIDNRDNRLQPRVHPKATDNIAENSLYQHSCDAGHGMQP